MAVTSVALISLGSYTYSNLNIVAIIHTTLKKLLGEFVFSDEDLKSFTVDFIESFGHKKLYALNADGTKHWEFDAGGNVYSSPAVGADGTIYVGSYDDNLYALNSDGTRKWDYTTGDNVYGSPSIGADGTVYFGSADSFVYALNPDGTRKWRFFASGDTRSRPAIGADGTVYFGSEDHNVYAVGP